MAAPPPDAPPDLDTRPDGHRYNGDLLLQQVQRNDAYHNHAAAYHVLNHPQLRERFGGVDPGANWAKKAARAYGFWAVVMALASLLIASSEAAWGGYPAPAPVLLKWSAAVLGLLAVLVGWAGVLVGPRKMRWLISRMRTERMRQFHFQTFLFRFDDILRSVAAVRSGDPAVADAAVAKYRADRVKWFEEYVRTQEYDGNPEKLEKLLGRVVHADPDHAPPVWVHGDGSEPKYPGGVYDKDDLSALFKAYASLRFGEQVGYATHVLRTEETPPAPPSTAAAAPPDEVPVTDPTPLADWIPPYPGRTWRLRRWQRVLKVLWRIALLTTVALHFLSLVPGLSVEDKWLHIFGVWAALVAVAVRTVAEGMAVNREIERYEEYLAICSELLRRFQASGTPPEELFRLMVQMERTSFEEMRAFLRSNLEAAYVV